MGASVPARRDGQRRLAAQAAGQPNQVLAVRPQVTQRHGAAPRPAAQVRARQDGAEVPVPLQVLRQQRQVEPRCAGPGLTDGVGLLDARLNGDKQAVEMAGNMLTLVIDQRTSLKQLDYLTQKIRESLESLKGNP